MYGETVQANSKALSALFHTCISSLHRFNLLVRAFVYSFFDTAHTPHRQHIEVIALRTYVCSNDGTLTESDSIHTSTFIVCISSK